MNSLPARSLRGPARLRVRPPFLVLGLIAILALPFLTNPFQRPGFLGDFRGDVYAAGQAILHGVDPYDDGFVAREAAMKRAGGPDVQFAVPVYPAPTLLAVTPLSALPYELAATLWFLMSAIALLAGLRLLGVQDIRCLAVIFVWLPVVHGLALGAIEPLLLLGVAVAWRWRHSVTTPALAIASVVIAKLILWPVGVWLLLTRRLRTFWVALAIAAGATITAWAVIGFAGMVEYPRMLGNLSFLEQADGVSLVASLLAIGFTPVLAHGIAFAVAGLLLLAAWRVAHSPAGERRAFGLVVMAGLSAATIAWPQYLVLLIVTIALCSPTLSPMWFVPLLAWLAPVPRTHDQLLLIAPYLAIEVIVVLWLLSDRLHGRLARGRRLPETAAHPAGLG